MCVCVSVCVVVRAGAYLLTAAALAAFSSACCCRTFRLTFHAEIKIADELEKETGATGGEEGERKKSELKCARSPSQECEEVSLSFL